MECHSAIKIRWLDRLGLQSPNLWLDAPETLIYLAEISQSGNFAWVRCG
jgi:hypothetical protein